MEWNQQRVHEIKSTSRSPAEFWIRRPRLHVRRRLGMKVLPIPGSRREQPGCSLVLRKVSWESRSKMTELWWVVELPGLIHHPWGYTTRIYSLLEISQKKHGTSRKQLMAKSLFKAWICNMRSDLHPPHGDCCWPASQSCVVWIAPALGPSSFTGDWTLLRKTK